MSKVEKKTKKAIARESSLSRRADCSGSESGAPKLGLRFWIAQQLNETIFVP